LRNAADSWVNALEHGLPARYSQFFNHRRSRAALPRRTAGSVYRTPESLAPSPRARSLSPAA